MDYDEEKEKPDIIDEDLYEEFDDEELYELVQEEREKALERAQQDKSDEKTTRRFPKWPFWLIAIVMVFNVIALLPQTFSIPAIDFLITSAELSTNEEIQSYKEAVVVIETDENKGTGFAISAEGTILTNHHVIEGEESVTAAFPENGLFSAEVVDTYPEIDIAVLETEAAEYLPYLELADEAAFEVNDPIYFIGNPLQFNGIANKGNMIGYTQLASWEEEVLMIEAPVYRGNSGSPVINDDGEVIGVIFATLDHETHGNVGLLVPIDYYYEFQ
ncbi:S1-C subfamily serine protease [Virgibacillus natechei]|uniref:S1-C subfamily serine protease n=1 Tax=Virgibacillus natechei TaxID=1216297 RepID=A0ABS4IGS4_9BACI|nr:serine protease [Virgibacillus natechei]MBP1970150.1 S1-C subfamily serine protease [Virgibacillus natechei]UZD14221.1 serine protease [Virgibacillus natechei]